MTATNALLSLTLCTAMLPSALFAQTERTALSLVPNDALLVVQCDGPAKLEKQFAKTRLLAALSDADSPIDTVSAFRAIEGQLQTLAESFGLDWADFCKQFRKFGGRITVAVGADLASAVDGGSPHPWVAVIVSPDENVNLASLAKQLTTVAEEDEAGLLGDLRVASDVYRVVKLEGSTDTRASLPFMVGRHMVVAIGDQLEQTIGSIAGSGPGLGRLDETLGKHPIGVWVNIAPLKQMLRTGVRTLSKQIRTGTPVPITAEDIEQALDLLGVMAPTEFELGVDGAGEHVLFDAALGLDKDRRGFFDAVAPLAAGQPKLLELVPFRWENWAVSAFDFEALYKLITKAVETFGPKANLTMQAVEALVQQRIKLHPKLELFDYLGKEMISVGTTQYLDGNGNPLTGTRALNGLCIGVQITDHERFAKSIDRLLRSFALHVNRKTEKYNDIDVHTIRFFGMVPLHYTVSNRVFVFAAGPDGLRGLHSILDEEDRAERNRPKEKGPEEFTERLKHVPENLNGLQLVNTGSMLEMLLSQAQQVLYKNPQLTDDQKDKMAVRWLRQTTDMITLLKRHELHSAVIVTGATLERVTWRAIW